MKMRQPVSQSPAKIFCGLFGTDKEQLSEGELISFYQLRQLLNVPFTPELGLNRFRYLYQLYFHEHCPADIRSPRWLELGFQSEHPETDLRSIGMSGLEVMIYFVEREHQIVHNMSKSQSNFFFAISSINITHWLRSYLHLSSDKNKAVKVEKCSRKTLKNFVRMLSTNIYAFEELHRLALLHLYVRLWRPMSTEGSRLLLNNYNKVFDLLVEDLKKCLKGNILSWQHFESLWQQQY